MMQQYFAIKNEYKDCLLFYRLGDFYEMFFEDAALASKVLELTLTGRDCGEEERAPMCGVPYHAADAYIGKLIECGYRVAICEQVEDPAAAKGLVRREVIRVVTPGTVVDAGQLSEQKNNYLCAISNVGERIGICFADVSTGQLTATMFDGGARFTRLTGELAVYSPSEIILQCPPEELKDAGLAMRKRIGTFILPDQAERFDEAVCRDILELQLGRTYVPTEDNLPVTLAAGALIGYIKETQKTDLSYFYELQVYMDGQYLEMDASTRRNLELTEAMRTGEKKGTLLWVLDQTKTAMGARMLRKWVELPLVNLFDIERRLDAVNELYDEFLMREELMMNLTGVLDMERLTTKLVYGTANGRDLNAIAATMRILPEVRRLLANAVTTELCTIAEDMDTLEDMEQLISENIAEDAPVTIREGGIIRDGADEEIDYLRNVVKNSSDIIRQMEERERDATGIKNLRIRYNRVFGYYIEVTKSQIALVPDTYTRKQTTANAERYITDELKDTEATLLGAEDRLHALEYERFGQICKTLIENVMRIKHSSELVARLDAYLSLADTAVKHNFVRPEVNSGDVIDIRDGRHPVVEKFVDDSYFVPNDTLLDTRNNRLMLITGPNMAGKSTYMRQVALITLMAQIGSFVPAKSAVIGICDRIFTRVGASDDLASGQSTFMLEMNEVAHILKNATKKSLIIYDEIGRGTSTFDGMSIARAIVEFTASPKLGAKTLFATHYHELTELENSLEGVVNYNIAAKKRGDDITFLRKIVRGAADDSYGIEVAKLAGVPNAVIKRAKEILAEIEAGGLTSLPPAPKPEPEETTVEMMLAMSALDTLRGLSIETLTPIEAMNELYKLKKMLG
ncbi:MAG: DNA mismatch repair protein MutS [Ruminococcaceae bacterium]|nr:DNA mismatch repair protein MutS [Oscillospiraceae bacterium]